MANFPSPPVENSLIRSPEAKPGQPPKTVFGFAADPWIEWFREIVLAFSRVAQRLKTVDLGTPPQSASIPTTPIPTGTLRTPLMQVTYYARITRAASVSSSLIVTLGWLDGGVACTYSGAAMTANTVNTTQTGTVLVRSDPASAVTYATTYASSGGTSMQYSLIVTTESAS